MSAQCDNFKEEILDFIAGILSPQQKQQLAEHLKTCPDCAQLEQILKNEEKSLTGLFENLTENIKRQEDEVISAIGCYGTTAKEKISLKIRTFFDSPVLKFAVAAAILAFIAINYVKTISWINELEYFMNTCSVMVK